MQTSGLTDVLQLLAKEFPERFRFDGLAVEISIGRDIAICDSGTWIQFDDGYGHEISSRHFQALLHAVLVELVKEAGFVLVQSPLNERGWSIWTRTESGLSKPLFNVANNGAEPTPIAAVLAAAPEIKRRLGVTT